MPSTVDGIITGVVTLIQGVSGVPSLVVARKTDVFHPNKPGGDPSAGIVVSLGFDRLEKWNENLSVDHALALQISYYKPTQPAVDYDDTNPALFQAIKSALSVTTISGTPVWDFDIAESREWEAEKFGEGTEVSRFGVLYRYNVTP